MPIRSRGTSSTRCRISCLRRLLPKDCCHFLPTLPRRRLIALSQGHRLLCHPVRAHEILARQRGALRSSVPRPRHLFRSASSVLYTFSAIRFPSRYYYCICIYSPVPIGIVVLTRLFVSFVTPLIPHWLPKVVFVFFALCPGVTVQ